MTRTSPAMHQWPRQYLGDLLERVSKPVDVAKDSEYREIGIRSHSRGIFHKPPTTNEQIGSKRVFWIEPGCLILNIVFAWEQAVAVTSENERGMIASHRFPMFRSRNGELLPEYAYLYFSSPRGKYDLGSASPGGAGRNRTLGQEEFKHLQLPVPPIDVQRCAIATIDTWSCGIQELEKVIEAKRKLKSGLMLQLLTGKRRLKRFKATWEEYHIGDLFRERKEANRPDLPLLSITSNRGVIPFSELGKKDSSSDDKSKYKRIAPGDIGYNTMRMWQGVSALSSLEGIVSPAYTICIPNKRIDGLFASYYLKFPPIIHLFYRYSQGLVDDTRNLKFHNFSAIKVKVPPIEEQIEIAEAFGRVDSEISDLETVLDRYREQKKGLMQKLMRGEIRVPSDEERQKDDS